VGDANFQQKSLAKLKEVSQNGGVILFVSHNMTTVAAICNKVMVLDRGNVTFELGNASDAIEHYLNFAKQTHLKHKADSKISQNTTAVKVLDFLLMDANGISQDTLTSGMPIAFVIDYEIDPAIQVDDVGFSILFKTLNGDVIANISSQNDVGTFAIQKRTGRIGCSIDHFPIAPGMITMALIIERRGEVLDIIEDIFVGEVDRGGHLREHIVGDRKGWVEIAHKWEML
jgi:lipopolysaccharide transport system ATP-binding protein